MTDGNEMKRQKAPRCPYCGAEMSLEDNEDVLLFGFVDEEKMYWYQCNTPSCDFTARRVTRKPMRTKPQRCAGKSRTGQSVKEMDKED